MRGFLCVDEIDPVRNELAIWRCGRWRSSVSDHMRIQESVIRLGTFPPRTLYEKSISYMGRGPRGKVRYNLSISLYMKYT